MNNHELLITAIEAAIAGALEILVVYRQDFDVEFKEDKSPLTLADKRAHEAICRMLGKTGLPVLSEEGKNIPFSTRSKWKRFWLVDPLDGTKEFIKRNGEFTVNIALIINNKAEMGIILVPVTGQLYFASASTGSRKINVGDLQNVFAEQLISDAVKLPFYFDSSKLTVVCSRSHMSPETAEYVKQLEGDGFEMEYVFVGSSLKLCLIAEGKARVYPRFGPTMEWDTAAGQAIVEKSGGQVLLTGSPDPVKYNKPDLLNPWFIASRPE